MNLRKLIQYAISGYQLQIAHRVPGRLRVVVPELAMMPEGFEEHISAGRKTLEKLPGVKSVSVNTYTQGVLFHYDPVFISESELLGWLEDLVEYGIKKFSELDDEKNIHTRILKLQAHLRAGVEMIRKQHAATEKN